MKKILKINILTICALCLISLNSIAQISANLVLNSRPPSYLSDWGNGRAGQLIINNISPVGGLQPIEIILSTKILNESGDIIAKSNLNMAKHILINAKSQIIRMDQVLQLENMQFSNAQYLARTGKLEPGLYTLVVSIYEAKTGKQLVEQIQRQFSQVNYVLPYLMTPQNEAWLDANVAQSAIIFRWSGLVPNIQENVTYKLTVFEILSNQTPMQALRSNQPILNVDINRLTQYIWHPQLDMKTFARTFIWTVQSLDYRGEIISSTDYNMQGRSEPRVFGICNSNEVNKLKCGEGYNWHTN